MAEAAKGTQGLIGQDTSPNILKAEAIGICPHLPLMKERVGPVNSASGFAEKTRA
jgi:hypothetical protein